MNMKTTNTNKLLTLTRFTVPIICLGLSFVVACHLSSDKSKRNIDDYQKIAATFLQVRSDELTFDRVEQIPIGEQYIFYCKSIDAEIAVGSKTMQVTYCIWWKRTKALDKDCQLTQEQALAIAEAFLMSRNLKPIHDHPSIHPPPFRWLVRWTVETEGVRTPFGQEVEIDPCTKSVFSFSQWLQPIQISVVPAIDLEKAKAIAIANLPPSFRVAECKAGPESLAVQLWGRPIGTQRLTWTIRFVGELRPERLLEPLRPGWRWSPPIYTVIVDAHSGEVLSKQGRPQFAEEIPKDKAGEAKPR
jgi:hypothetical protein